MSDYEGKKGYVSFLYSARNRLSCVCVCLATVLLVLITVIYAVYAKLYVCKRLVYIKHPSCHKSQFLIFSDFGRSQHLQIDITQSSYYSSHMLNAIITVM